MRLRKRFHAREKSITIRVTEKEYNQIKIKAGLYTDGNLSEWIACAALSYRPPKAMMEK